MPPTVTLKKKLERILHQGHPWVYRDALIFPKDLPAGMFVTLLGKNEKPIAHGFWDPVGPIAFRVLSLSPVPDPEALVRQRLTTALALRRSWFDERLTNAFRWIHGEADRLPGIHIDRYADVASVRFDGQGSRAFYRGLDQALMEIGVLTKVVDREEQDRPSHEIEIRENGLRFWVDLGRGQKGGLFLDQRDNRAQVETLSRGKSVLNLFGYTGAFSLYAVRGGALHTDTVDIAMPALEAARRNFELNGFSLDHAHFHATDAFTFLESAVARKTTWDLVISDPPSFAPSKHSVESAKHAYHRLHSLVSQVVTPGGIMCAASCSSHIPPREFLSDLENTVHRQGRRFVLQSFAGAGRDHPTLPVFPEGDYLKFAIGSVQ
jgi:23S rRNA (cytosine1962-C5)-methyltransferase